MPYFHATFEKHIASIRKFGLGGLMVEQNTPGCTWGVYLGATPEIGITVLLADALDSADDTMSPAAWYESIRVIVIDDARIDPSLLGEDESFPDQEEVRIYRGKIDVTGLPILNLDQVVPKNLPSSEEDLEEARQFLLRITGNLVGEGEPV